MKTHVYIKLMRNISDEDTMMAYHEGLNIDRWRINNSLYFSNFLLNDRRI